jgi:hypothetical protein
VISYYEFLQPIANRLTDEEWREEWENGRMPAPPQWTRSYLATHDVASLMKRTSAGEAVPDLLWLNDPALTAALEKAVQPGGSLVGKSSYGWALEVATRKLGVKMVPLLLNVLKNGETSIKMDDRVKYADGGYERYCSPAEMAARSLLLLDNRLDAAASKELSAIEDATRSEQIVSAAGRSRSAAAMKVLVDIVIGNPHIEVKRKALESLERSGWTAGVPPLTAYWPKAPDELKALLLETTNRMLGDPPRDLPGLRGIGMGMWSPWGQEYPRPPAETYAKWAADFLRLAAAGIADKNDEVSHLSIRIIGERYREVEAIMAKAEPAIGARLVAAVEKAVPLDKIDRDVADALAEMGTDAAADLLVRYSHVEDAERRKDVVWALGNCRSERVLPRLRELLDDQAPAQYSLRFCDFAAATLNHNSFRQQGPGFDWDEPEDQRDARIKAWKEFLDKRGK